MALVMYELLVRNDPITGINKGSHVKLYDNVLMKEGDAMSLTAAAALGYTLTDVLSEVEMGAIKATTTAIAERDAANATIASLQAQLAASVK